MVAIFRNRSAEKADGQLAFSNASCGLFERTAMAKYLQLIDGLRWEIGHGWGVRESRDDRQRAPELKIRKSATSNNRPIHHLSGIESSARLEESDGRADCKGLPAFL